MTTLSPALSSLSNDDLARGAAGLPFRRAARAAVGETPSVPVEVVDGAAAPVVQGEGWCYRTTTGLPIRSPSAYRRRGWSAMVYHPSTYRVVVGRDWRPE